MENKVFFKIADHVLEVNFPADFILLDYLPNFNLFIMNDEEIRIAQEPKLKVSISLSRVQHFDEKLKVHTESSEIWGEGFKFEEGISCFITSWTDLVENTKFAVVSSKDFTESTVYLGEGNDNKFQMISWALMVVFGQAVLPYNTLMIHASAVEKDGKEAYAFLGKSGTGKSTHSQLWLKYLNNFTLLNDDNPAIRVFEDNKVFI